MVEIPDSQGDYWFVWFDAPDRLHRFGQSQWCDREKENRSAIGGSSAETEIHHFIGKDITYFHTLCWPAMLTTAGFIACRGKFTFTAS